jgi:molybdopterin converting factor small subunit
VRVSLNLFASLREGRYDSREVELPSRATIADLLGLAGLPPPDIAIIFVDGRHADPETFLHEGARVALFPPVGGG